MFKKCKLTIAISLFLLVLTSCATKLKSVQRGGKISLGQGYMLLNVATNIDLSKIRINGRKNYELTKHDLAAGNNYILLPLAAGDYNITRVVFNTFRGTGYVDLKEPLWRFKVWPGAVGYVGHMEVESSFWGTQGKYMMINRSTRALEFLENNYPDILNQHGVVYRGPGEDNFFEVVGADRPAARKSKISATHTTQGQQQ